MFAVRDDWNRECQDSESNFIQNRGRGRVQADVNARHIEGGVARKELRLLRREVSAQMIRSAGHVRYVISGCASRSTHRMHRFSCRQVFEEVAAEKRQSEERWNG